MTDPTTPSEPETPDATAQAHPRQGPSRLEAGLVAVVVLGLGAVAAVMLVAGHHPWDGGVVVVLGGSHGLHRGDILAIGPAVVSVAAAWWCWRQGRA